MRVFITGIAGYIGSNLALRLRKEGCAVRGLDALNDYYSTVLKRQNCRLLVEAGCFVSERDLAKDDLAGVLDGCDAVVHLAGQPGISARTSWDEYNRNNVVATHRLLEEAKRSGINQFVNISSSSVYGIRATDAEDAEPKPASWYGETKLAAELEVMGTERGLRDVGGRSQAGRRMERSGFSACSLRLFSVFGERERPEKLFPRLIRAIARDEPFPLFEGSLEHERSFSYVGDICEGIAAVLANWDEARGEIFNLGTSRCFTTGDAIRTVEAVMGKKADLEILPPRPGDQKATHANIEKIRSALGWEPRTSLEEGVERMVKWYMDEVHEKIDWV